MRKLHIFTHYHAQCARLLFKLVQNTNTFKSGFQFSIKIAKDHLQVKGQGHQLDAGIKIGFKNGVPHSSFIYRPNRLKMH